MNKNLISGHSLLRKDFTGITTWQTKVAVQYSTNIVVDPSNALDFSHQHLALGYTHLLRVLVGSLMDQQLIPVEVTSAVQALKFRIVLEQAASTYDTIRNVIDDGDGVWQALYGETGDVSCIALSARPNRAIYTGWHHPMNEFSAC